MRGGAAAHAHGSAGSAGECWLRPNCSSQPPSLDALLLTCDIFPASASLCCRRLGFGLGGWACRSDSLEIDVFKLCTSTVYVLGRCGRSKKINCLNQILLSASPWERWRTEKRRWWRWWRTWLPGRSGQEDDAPLSNMQQRIPQQVQHQGAPEDPHRGEALWV